MKSQDNFLVVTETFSGSHYQNASRDFGEMFIWLIQNLNYRAAHQKKPPKSVHYTVQEGTALCANVSYCIDVWS